MKIYLYICSMKWTEENINLLKEGINNKLTYSEIAIILNTNRNSVRLKAQRLNLKSKYSERLHELKEIKYCKNCKKEFECLISENRKFCSSSCSAKISNKNINRHTRNSSIYNILKNNCKNCGTLINIKNIYCSQKCHREYDYKNTITEWKNGKLCGYKGKTKAISNWLRKYMLEKTNNTCQKCGWNNRHPIDDKPLVEINHIDGNAENNCEDNLEVLCPNCHSMTHNFKSRNKNSARNRK